MLVARISEIENILSDYFTEIILSNLKKFINIINIIKIYNMAR